VAWGAEAWALTRLKTKLIILKIKLIFFADIIRSTSINRVKSFFFFYDDIVFVVAIYWFKKKYLLGHKHK